VFAKGQTVILEFPLGRGRHRLIFDPKAARKVGGDLFDKADQAEAAFLRRPKP
jgi:hypothetical protein